MKKPWCHLGNPQSHHQEALKINLTELVLGEILIIFILFMHKLRGTQLIPMASVEKFWFSMFLACFSLILYLWYSKITISI